MMIQQIVKGRTMKTVTLSDMPNDQCEAYAFGTALEAARETRDSIFGYTISFYEDDDMGICAKVILHTD